MTKYYKNPYTGKVRKVGSGFSFKAFFFGWMYLAYKGMWKHAIVTLILALLFCWTYYIIPLIIWIVIGVKFNEEYETHLIEEGYEIMEKELSK